MIIMEENILKEKLKEDIIKTLGLHLVPSEIINDMPLFGDEGIGLDSIDAIDLVSLLENNYGVEIEDMGKGKEIIRSIDSIAAYVMKKG